MNRAFVANVIPVPSVQLAIESLNSDHLSVETYKGTVQETAVRRVFRYTWTPIVEYEWIG